MNKEIASNPAWADELLGESWEALEARCASLGSPDLMPKYLVQGSEYLFPELEEPWKRSPERELGCGFFGCVYETSVQDTVFKITTDESEAKFINMILQQAESGIARPNGLVRYHGCYVFPDLVQHKGERTVAYAVWREKALVIGDNVIDWLADRPNIISPVLGKDFIRNLDQGQSYALHLRNMYRSDPTNLDWLAQVRLSLSDQAGEPGEAVKNTISNYLTSNARLSQNDLGMLMGETFLDLARRGVILADVHAGNIALVERAGISPVISDPGLAVFFDPDLLNLEIPEL